MSFITPGFFSLGNNWNLLFNLMPLVIVSIGQTCVMLTGGIDLSITSTIALSSVVGASFMSSDSGLGFNPSVSTFIGIGVMLVVGAAIGLVNGVAVTKLGMPAFMVTLTTMMFFSGFAVWLTESQNIYNLPDSFLRISSMSMRDVPIPVVAALGVMLIAYFILNTTVIGEWIYAVGLNVKVARISGVNVDGTIISCYVFCGVCAALGAVLYTSRLETGSPIMGQNILLDVIGAVVIGGTSLFGGKGKVKWTLFGVLFISLLDNGLNLIGLSYFLIMIVKGLVILFAAILNVLKERPSLAS
ncbi:ABC transporter permease [Puniceicoccaceae bacterium K14]|nr:ABC transporter permease [Puniceicoccaceae bacterium K14]